MPVRDGVPHFDQLGQLAVAVPDVRHPVLEVHLRGLEGDVGAALPVEDRVFLAVLPETGAVETRVHVGVDEAGGEELPRPVDDPCPVGHRRGGARPQGGDPIAFDHHGGVRQRFAPVPVDDRGPDDGNRLLGDSLRG